MKVIPLLLACAAALLVASTPACTAQPAFPAESGWLMQHYSFEPMSADEQAKLRHAIARCAKVELALHWIRSGKHYRICNDRCWQMVQREQANDWLPYPYAEWVCELPRGAELDAILSKLAAVPQWYSPVFDKQICVNPGASRCIRFLDAKGRELYSERRAYGPWTSCKGEQGERVSLLSFFPDFPTHSRFDE